MTTTELPAWATAVTAQIPMSPFIHFDRYRRKILDDFSRCEQKILDDFTAEDVELVAYLDSLRGLNPPPIQPVPQKRRRWRR